MKFRGHETFFIRKGWLSKGMKNVNANPDVFISKEINPMDALGIGSNMVKSLRYWMMATGLATEPNSGRREQHLTDIGNIIWEADKYLEEMGTLLLLQYHLAANEKEATAWYFFFNEFKMQEFTKEDFLRNINGYLSMHIQKTMPAERVLTDDFNCIINTYLPRYKSNPGKISPENNIDSPLGEIGLIDFRDKEKKIYKKAVPSTKLFHPWIVLAILKSMTTANEISLDKILHAPGGFGRVFNLDMVALLEILRRAERLGLLKIIRTAGLDLVQLTIEDSALDCIRHYYNSLNNR